MEWSRVAWRTRCLKTHFCAFFLAAPLRWALGIVGARRRGSRDELSKFARNVIAIVRRLYSFLTRRVIHGITLRDDSRARLLGGRLSLSLLPSSLPSFSALSQTTSTRT